MGRKNEGKHGESLKDEERFNCISFVYSIHCSIGYFEMNQCFLKETHFFFFFQNKPSSIGGHTKQLELIIAKFLCMASEHHQLVSDFKGIVHSINYYFLSLCTDLHAILYLYDILSSTE